MTFLDFGYKIYTIIAFFVANLVSKNKFRNRFFYNCSIIFRSSFIILCFLIITTCGNDSSKTLIMRQEICEFVSNIQNFFSMKKKLLNAGFHVRDIEKIINDLNKILGSHWYDQKGNIKISYELKDGVKLINKVNFHGLGKAICLHYETIISQSTISGKLKNLLVIKGIVNQNFAETISSISGIPLSLRRQMMRFYKGANLKLSSGDQFAWLYDVHDFSILSAFIQQNTKKKIIVLFKSSKGEKYFSSDGSSVVGKKIHYGMPVPNSRISSTFKHRFHPVLKIWRFHYGVDYAAPYGSRIVATASGKVIFMGNKGGCGKTVILQHGHITTLYGHMSKFANISVGSQINKGETIGYIGMTGVTSGPHCHYEISVYGTKVDPLKFYQTVYAKLDGEELSIFKEYLKRLLKYFT